MTRVVSKKLRDSARDQTCTLRLPGCGHDDGTVVLAHLPCGQKGMGMKSPDQMAIFACHVCHSTIDGAKRWEVDAADYLRALAETQLIWIRMGLLKVA
ncbi:nuclease domain-containing protein [Pseudomonas lundensis]|uniref:nuclease domain-containing protein n=1 Tax=Pseudomonas lundensis TaxID=86185 RepID=UPI0030B9D974